MYYSETDENSQTEICHNQAHRESELNRKLFHKVIYIPSTCILSLNILASMSVFNDQFMNQMWIGLTYPTGSWIGILRQRQEVEMTK